MNETSKDAKDVKNHQFFAFLGVLAYLAVQSCPDFDF
jgi:hypothetical protein